MSHAKATEFEDFTQRLIKKFDKKKSKEKKPPPNFFARALTSGEGTLAPLQSVLDILTFRVPFTIGEMHEEEETYTSTDAAIEEQPSSSLVGKVITQALVRYAHVSIL